MLKNKNWLIGLTLLGAAACGDAGVTEDETAPFDGDENDEEVLAGKADGVGGFQPGCDKPASPIYALGGTILLPAGPVTGYVVMQDEKISKIAMSKADVPMGATIVDTGGVISPGLIDLHNHVAYNFLPLWETGKRFQNRYQWARISSYSTVKTPYNAVKKAGHLCEAVKYGEYRAMVGGTTTIQGSIDQACVKSWVRNVENVNFCEDHVRQNVLAIKDTKPEEAQNLNSQFTSNATRAYLVHLAEGIDASSSAEFESLRSLGLLNPQVVGIHSTGLTTAQINEMGKIGMKIVWSPLSNLLLYGKTTNIPAALAAGVKVSLAPDWTPSGSANVLGEMKVADRVNKMLFSGAITDKQIFEMATQNPAQIVGLGDKIGQIGVGYFADLVVVKGDTSKPYRALIDAKPQDVLLTLVSGKVYFGDSTMTNKLDPMGSYTTVNACGTMRSLKVTEADSRVTKGTQTLADITGTFTKDGVTNIIPLFQCTAAPESAFVGISK